MSYDEREEFFHALGEAFGDAPRSFGAPRNFRTVVPVMYRVLRGDTLLGIARKFHVTSGRAAELLLANPHVAKVRLSDGTWSFAVGAVVEGDRLRVPVSWTRRAPRKLKPRNYAGPPQFFGAGTCDPGYTFVEDPTGITNGGCVIDPTDPYWTNTGTTGGTTTTSSCGEHQIDDGQGGCTCEAGYQDDGSGGCMPIAQTGTQGLLCAAGGGTWDDSTGFCACPAGQVWDADKAACGAPTDVTGQCNAAGGVWNGQWCECNPGHRYVNGACVPVSQNDCATGEIYDENGPQGPNCYICDNEGTVYDPASHSCVCKSGLTWDQATRTCKAGGTGGGKTPPPPNPSCPAGQVLVNGLCTTPGGTGGGAAAPSKASVPLLIAILIGLGYGAYEITKYLAEKKKAHQLHLLPSGGKTRRHKRR